MSDQEEEKAPHNTSNLMDDDDNESQDMIKDDTFSGVKYSGGSPSEVEIEHGQIDQQTLDLIKDQILPPGLYIKLPRAMYQTFMDRKFYFLSSRC